MPGRARSGNLIQELSRANPWWIDSNWPSRDPQLMAAADAPFQRAPEVLKDIRPPNLYTLRGPRRAGKSTVLKQTILRLCKEGIDSRRVCYFAADALSTFNDLIALFRAALQLFPDLAGTSRYFLIDEVTSIPEWQRAMKWIRDNTSVAHDCVVATGSSARDIAFGVSYLAGRRGPDAGLDRLLLPMSFPEFARCAGYTLPIPPRLPLADFYTERGRTACQGALIHMGTLGDAFEAYLLTGGFPQAVSDFRRTAQVSDGFMRDLWDVVQSDLRTAGIARPENGLKLLERIAASLTGPLVMRTLGEDLAVAHTTASDWLDALADAYLLLFLFQESGGVPAIRKQRKAYPIDPLLARLPARMSSGVPEPEVSKLAEAAVAVTLVRSVEGTEADRFGRPDRLFYFRTTNGTEVDFLVPSGPFAAESKYIDTASIGQARAMVANFGGGLLLTRSAVDIQAGVTILPTPLFAWLLDQR